MTPMSWYVVRLPETGGVGVVPETALDHYRGRGWLRVSDALNEDARDQVVPDDYVDAPDLDVPPGEPAGPQVQPEPEPEQQPADTNEE